MALAGLLLAACGSKVPPPGVRLGSGAGRGGATGGDVSTGGGAATGPGTAPGDAPTTFQVSFPTSAIGYNLDLLFVIDDSSQMSWMQQKLLMQVPTLFQVLEGLPGGIPNLHVAVISSDMGAPGDATASLGCTAAGDGGQFQSQPRGMCTATTLASGATFLSNAASGPNFTGPIESAVQCIGQLGTSGCGFQQPLAAVARALGADGAPPPAANAGFLRPNAPLGIVILSNQDDCSAPADTTIFSLNGGQQSITNPDGPLTRYRCNGGPRGAHLCTDPATASSLVPPINPPRDAVGTPPFLPLSSCADNTSGSSALTPVDTFVQEIRALKPDPDHQISVSAITAPASPYDVQWVPPFSSTPDGSNQLWPQIMHACGISSDGSFGDPAVRTRQFAGAFPSDALVSICDSNYRQGLSSLALLAAALPAPSCIAPPATIQRDTQGYPACTVVHQRTDGAGRQTTVLTPNCNENGGVAPCWTLTANARCPSGLTFNLNADQAAVDAASLTVTMNCALCPPSSGGPTPSPC